MGQALLQITKFGCSKLSQVMKLNSIGYCLILSQHQYNFKQYHHHDQCMIMHQLQQVLPDL